MLGYGIADNLGPQGSGYTAELNRREFGEDALLDSRNGYAGP
jgi:hypothetical protein